MKKLLFLLIFMLVSCKTTYYEPYYGEIPNITEWSKAQYLTNDSIITTVYSSHFKRNDTLFVVTKINDYTKVRIEYKK